MLGLDFHLLALRTSGTPLGDLIWILAYDSSLMVPGNGSVGVGDFSLLSMAILLGIGFLIFTGLLHFKRRSHLEDLDSEREGTLGDCYLEL